MITEHLWAPFIHFFNWKGIWVFFLNLQERHYGLVVIKSMLWNQTARMASVWRCTDCLSLFSVLHQYLAYQPYFHHSTVMKSKGEGDIKALRAVSDSKQASMTISGGRAGTRGLPVCPLDCSEPGEKGLSQTWNLEAQEYISQVLIISRLQNQSSGNSWNPRQQFVFVNMCTFSRGENP